MKSETIFQKTNTHLTVSQTVSPRSGSPICPASDESLLVHAEGRGHIEKQETKQTAVQEQEASSLVAGRVQGFNKAYLAPHQGRDPSE